MENVLLVGLSAQIALRRSMEIVANNVANVSTAAYKREAPLFEQLLVSVESPDRITGQSEVAFVRDYGVTRDLNPGTLEQTGNALDVALNGAGYFSIQAPQGERYARDGHFKLDINGRLVTANGHPVLGEGGEITLPTDAKEIKIAADGTISTATGIAGKLRVVEFANPHLLRKEGNNLYAATETPTPPKNASIAQGMIERSNVEAVLEMTKMIEITRAYQAVSESLSQSEEAIRRAVQKLAEVKA
jgi:flagellar basal-body rod protein FlgF